MGPLGFLTGVVLGSAASIALVLAMVVVIFALSPGSAAAAAEYPRLLATAGLFAAQAALAGVAFAGLQRQRPWRWYAQAAMWLALALLGWYYWPRGGA
ncbi:MAG: hypothetical protein WBO00_05415 [Steroidobacteraceae bacterium]